MWANPTWGHQFNHFYCFSSENDLFFLIFIPYHESRWGLKQLSTSIRRKKGRSLPQPGLFSTHPSSFQCALSSFLLPLGLLPVKHALFYSPDTVVNTTVLTFICNITTLHLLQHRNAVLGKKKKRVGRISSSSPLFPKDPLLLSKITFHTLIVITHHETLCVTQNAY